MPAFGSTINPALGRTDYSAYTQGAAQGASQIGQGMAQLGQGIGSAIKQYNIKKEEKELNEAAKQELKRLAKENPKIAKEFNITNPDDDKQYDAGVKAYGPKAALQMAQGFKQQAEADAKNDRIGKIAMFMANNNGQLPEGIAANLKADEYIAAQSMAQEARKKEADIAKTIEEANTLKAGKRETPSEFGVAYNAFNLANPNATAEDIQKFVSDFKKSGSPVTNVNMGEDAFNKEAGKRGAEAIGGAIEASTKLPDQLSATNEAINLIKGGNVSAGMLAEGEVFVNKVKSLFGDKKAGEKVSDSEYLDTLLGKDVFAQIGQLGIGARGLDTPAEREFIRKTVSGSRELTPDTLIKMQQVKKNILSRAIKKYNDRIDSGEFDKYFEASGIMKQKLEAPEIVDINKEPKQGMTKIGRFNVVEVK